MTFFSPDSDNSDDIIVVFNLTNGNSDNLLSPLPNVTLSPNSSQKVVNFHKYTRKLTQNHSRSIFYL